MPSAAVSMEEKLKTLPAKAGVYLMKDASGKVIYVGKAASLRHRVQSYFQDGDLAPRVRSMVERVRDFDYLITTSEVEALVLEFTLIQRHRPRYNVRFRDDKRYPYIKITVAEKHPAILVVRRQEEDGARYFGPYPSSRSMWETIRLLRKTFRLRMANYGSGSRRAGCPWRPARGRRQRACLYYYIGECLGPCVEDLVSDAEYQEAVRETVLFLEGRHAGLLEALREQMEQSAAEMRFEAAARIRDRLQAVERVTERQEVVSPRGEEADVVALAIQEDTAAATVLQIRDGRLIGQTRRLLEGVTGLPDAEILAEFVSRHYQLAASVPREILLPRKLPDQALVATWLAERRGGAVRLLVPRRGRKRDLLAMAEENAAQHLHETLERESVAVRRGKEAVADIQRALKLSLPPERIEAFDISTLFGGEAVGSMIVFEGGLPRRDEYRRFRIRLGNGKPDDTAMMREMLDRRLQAAVSGNVKFEKLPDLLLVDGGLGQLNVARRALADLNLRLPIAGLAKRHEEIYLPDRAAPLLLPAHSRALHLLQRVRDEAHRFALAYHRRLRARKTRESVLDEISGVGPGRKQLLLARYSSISQLRRADPEQLATLPGIGRRLAEAILTHLREEDGEE
jgi:excinuclease ABC subunit C